jgi:hypothetical protein
VTYRYSSDHPSYHYIFQSICFHVFGDISIYVYIFLNQNKISAVVQQQHQEVVNSPFGVGVAFGDGEADYQSLDSVTNAGHHHQHHQQQQQEQPHLNHHRQQPQQSPDS